MAGPALRAPRLPARAHVLRPVAAHDPYSLYTFTWTNPAGRAHVFTWPEYEAFQQQNQVFSGVFASRKQLVTRVNGAPAYGELVTGNYFHLLGVNAVRGRTLDPSDSTAPGGESVVVLSVHAWQRLFAGDPNIVGRTILIGGWPCEVVGVAREDFSGLGEMPYDFWAPVTLDARLEDGADLFGPDRPARLELTGRLKPAATERSARAALTVWAKQWTAGNPGEEKATTALLVSRATNIPNSPGVLLLFAPMLAAFGLVLVIACANVANMMLARGMARQREIGIRLALGAARARLVRQLLTESVLLAVPAALVGFAIAQATLGFGVRAMFATLPAEYAEYMRVIPLAPDVRVFAFMMMAAVLSALLFGLAPALQATRTSVVQAARGDFMYDVSPTRLRHSLVVVQITASVLLLICAGVLLRGANRVGNTETGMRTRDVIEIEIREQSRARVVSTLAAESLVRGAAATSYVPLNGAPPTVSVTPTGAASLVRAWYRYVSPQYFSILDISLLNGRGFTQDEALAGAPVAIVSQTAARRLWGNRSAVGQTVRLVPDARVRWDARIGRYQTVQVVGVARDVALGLEGEPSGLYLPTSTRDAGTALLVQVAGDAEAARRALDTALTAVDPAAVREIHKMQEFVTARLYPFRAAHWISAVIGALALLLTVSGIYGVLSFVVTQRAKEIGVRMALGATVGAVIGLVLGQSLRLAAFGLPAGALLALGASKLFAAHLVMMNMFDSLAYGGGLLLVLAACVLASFFPALRAARIDPAARCDMINVPACDSPGGEDRLVFPATAH